MFKIDDYVVYGLTGVCKITDIEKDKIDDQESEFYVLNPVFSDNMTIKIPVNNAAAKMRKTITKEEALSLIESMPEQETVWLKDNRERSESFKAALKTGKSEEWAKIIKTIYEEKNEMAIIGKKLSKSDEDMFKAAEKQLNEEFAVALGISPDEVTEFILQRIAKDS
jgi:CarD family transcriptional regulator